VTFWQKEIGKKIARKMLMKLTPGRIKAALQNRIQFEVKQKNLLHFQKNLILL